MSRRPRTPMPVRRVAAFAATSAVLASLAHAVAGAALPNVWLLGLGALGVAGLSVPLAKREATWPMIVLGLAVAQGMLHGWLTLTASHHAHGADGSSGRMLVAHAVATIVAAVWLRALELQAWRRARLAWVAALIGRLQFGLPTTPRPVRAAVPESAPVSILAVFGSSRAVRGPPVSCCP